MADQVLAEDAGLAELNLARREHWVAQIERHAAARPDQPALRFRGATTTWRQLADRIGRLAGALARRGVRQGDRVAVMTGNCPEFLESVLAANALGAIAVPLNFRLSGPEAAFVLETREPRSSLSTPSARLQPTRRLRSCPSSLRSSRSGRRGTPSPAVQRTRMLLPKRGPSPRGPMSPRTRPR